MKKFNIWNTITRFLFVMLLTLSSCTQDTKDPIEPTAEEQLKKGILKGTLQTNQTLDATKKYALEGTFIVPAGKTLTIPAGTQVEARSGGVDVYLAVLRGGRIEVKGTADKPVIFASKEGMAGDWGGLTILGKAPTSGGSDASAEVGNFKYGGSVADDHSGSIEYLILRGSGASINSEAEFNGLSLYAVGSKTTISHIAVIDGSDDGVEFFGGTVSASYLYLKNNEDDSIDWTEGWNGTVTHAYILHEKAFSTVLEGDKANGNPTFKRITAICTDTELTKRTALEFKATSGATITELWLEGYLKPIDMKDDGPLSSVKIEGADAVVGGIYQKAGSKIDIEDASWHWITKRLK